MADKEEKSRKAGKPATGGNTPVAGFSEVMKRSGDKQSRAIEGIKSAVMPSRTQREGLEATKEATVQNLTVSSEIHRGLITGNAEAKIFHQREMIATARGANQVSREVDKSKDKIVKQLKRIEKAIKNIDDDDFDFKRKKKDKKGKKGKDGVDVDLPDKDRKKNGKDKDGKDIDIDADLDKDGKKKGKGKDGKDIDTDIDLPGRDPKKPPPPPGSKATPPPLPDTAKPGKKGFLSKIKGAVTPGNMAKAAGGVTLAVGASLLADMAFEKISETVEGMDVTDEIKAMYGNVIEKSQGVLETVSGGLGIAQLGSMLGLGGMFTGGAGLAGLAGTAVTGVGALGAGAVAGGAGLVGAAGYGAYKVGDLANSLITAGLGKSIGDIVYDKAHDAEGKSVLPEMPDLSTAGNWLSEKATGAWSLISESATGAFTAVSKEVTAVMPEIQSAVASVPGIVSSLSPLGAMTAWASGLADEDLTPEKVLQGITASAEGVGKVAGELGKEAGKEITDMIKDILGYESTAKIPEATKDTGGGGMRYAEQLYNSQSSDAGSGGGKSGGGGGSGGWDAPPTPAFTPAGGNSKGVNMSEVKAGNLSGHNLGDLSAEHESNNNPGAIGDRNIKQEGVSYGSYQMSSKVGVADKYVKQSEYASEFRGMDAGTQQFTQKWQEIARREPDKFHKSQHDYIKKTHYDPFVAKIKRTLGFDINKRSRALQDVAWSTAVQMGEGIGGGMWKNALKGQDPNQMSDADMINRLYGEREKTLPDGRLAYWKSSAAHMHVGMKKRFKKERGQALSMLKAEQSQPTAVAKTDTGTGGGSGGNGGSSPASIPGGSGTGGAAPAGPSTLAKTDTAPASSGAAKISPVESVRPVKPVDPVEPINPEDLVTPVGKSAVAQSGSQGAVPAGQAQTAGSDSDTKKMLAAIEKNTRPQNRKNDPSREVDSNIPTATGDRHLDAILDDRI